MTSVLRFIKNSYNLKIQQNPNQLLSFQLDCIQRIGKQIISIIISTGLIHLQITANNKDIVLALKQLQPRIMNKMELKDKKSLYRTFGMYFFQQITQMKDFQLVQLQLVNTFLKILHIQQKQQPQHQPQSQLTNQSFSNKINDISLISTTNSSLNNSTFNHSLINIINGLQKQNKNVIQSLNVTKENISIQINKTNDYSFCQKDKSIDATRNSINDISMMSSSLNQSVDCSNDSFYKNYDKFNIHDQSTRDLTRIQQDLEQNFCFQETQEDKQKNKRTLCDKHFIQVVGYLQKLSSPQGELTYIWQHLKWQGFQTQYQPFMNQANQWTCTAKIKLPLNMKGDNGNQITKTKKSKNKRKARQLACMALLKSLYLQYPQVWLIYKHLREEKKLVIPPLQCAKDDDELDLIRDSKNFKVNNEKVLVLFKHSKVDIRKKMQGISAKAQLNTLLQQLAGRVTSPKIEKKIVEGGNWQVPVKIQYKTYEDIQQNRKPKVYEAVVTYHNTRIAEEQAYMEAIIKMYQQNEELFQKMQSIKIAKNIQEPPKRIPLLRVMKEGVNTKK